MARRAAQMLRAATPLAVVLAAACGDGDPGAPSPAELVIRTDSLPHAIQLEPYSAGVDAEGGSGGYTWTMVAGALPAGVEAEVEDLSDDDLVVTGTPESVGTFPVSFRVHSEDGQTATRAFTLVVRPPPTPVAMGNVNLPPTVVGQPYDVPLRATGGDGVTFTWALVAGTLPPGLQLVETGRLTGSPSATGTFAFTLRVTSGASSVERAFTLRVVPDQRGAYNLTVYPVVSVPAAIQPHLDAAVARWEGIVTTDVVGGPIGPTFFTAQHCSGFGLAANGASVDDLLLMVNIDSIDGRGRVLGQAGPCGLRGNGMPFVGILILDEDDLMPLVGTSTLTAIITHEIGHVLGIGSLWDRFELLSGAGTSDPGYSGAAGVAAYQQLGGQADRVPVENQGGQGTAGSHWRESVFDTELMTGFSEPVGVPQPLSALTVASLVDLGYVVEADAADAYSLPTGRLRAQAVTPDAGFDIVGAGPLRVAPWGHSSTPPPSHEPGRP